MKVEIVRVEVEIEKAALHSRLTQRFPTRPPRRVHRLPTTRRSPLAQGARRSRNTEDDRDGGRAENPVIHTERDVRTGRAGVVIDDEAEEVIVGPIADVEVEPGCIRTERVPANVVDPASAKPRNRLEVDVTGEEISPEVTVCTLERR